MDMPLLPLVMFRHPQDPLLELWHRDLLVIVEPWSSHRNCRCAERM